MWASTRHLFGLTCVWKMAYLMFKHFYDEKKLTRLDCEGEKLIVVLQTLNFKLEYNTNADVVQ